MVEIKLRDEYIKLGQALKAANLVDSGVMAKMVIQDGMVAVNGEIEYQRGKKLVDGDIVSLEGEMIKIVYPVQTLRRFPGSYALPPCLPIKSVKPQVQLP